MTLKQLIENYKRRLLTVTDMIESYTDIVDLERLKTKAAEYRAFLSDLEKLKPDFEFEGVADNEGLIGNPSDVVIALTPGERYQITIKKLK